LRSERFGIEPELTIKIAKRQVSIYEIPINYHGRTYDEGKKIGLKDAFQAVFVILRCYFSRDIYADSGAGILDSLSNMPNFNRWMADTIKPWVGPRVLELGSGIGNLTRQIIARKSRYVASDIDDEHIARLKTRLQHRPGLEVCRIDLVEPAGFEPFASQMDTVVCLNVLEHVEDDRLGLANIASTLTPGGHAIVLVPEGPSVYGTLDKVLGHFRRYTEDELRTKMEQAGLRVETILRFNRITRPGWYVNGRILKRTSFSRFQLYVFDRLVWLWRRIDRLLPWKPTSIIGVGVKGHCEETRADV
jgi:2-polyprenyl-3-methyl-5-hydroxy-6-metoxy-1,4-benzoquinol methylase